MSDLLVYIVLWGSSIIVVVAFLYFLYIDLVGNGRGKKQDSEENSTL